MAISLKTNLTSLMTRRNLQSANDSMKSNIEKLSTGHRINPAADDAAGLAVSEGMKADLRSINQAKRNAHDAVSMLQTAEESMGQIHDILGRMKELAVQANSDSINDDHRGDLDEEFTQLTKEIKDIAEGTNFNGVNLLDGTFVDKSLQVGPAASDTLGLAISQNLAPDEFGLQ